MTRGSPATGRQFARQTRALLRLKRAILEDYSYRDLHHVNWRKRFARLGPTLRSSRSACEFAHEAVRLLAPARDIHLWLGVDGQVIPTYRRCVRRNIVPSLLPKLVPHLRRHNAVVVSGRFHDGIVYLCLRSWPAAAQRLLQPAYRVLGEAIVSGRPLIIDVRANSGGSEPLAARFAGRFVNRPVCYARHLTRRAGTFIGPIERWLKPNKARPRYQGQIAVLIGPGTVSSCESFVLMMKQVSGCKLIGQPTAGASGNPKPADLGNGVVVYVPSWLDLALDGTCLEGQGVPPDMEVTTAAEEHGEKDPVLTAALRWLRQSRTRANLPSAGKAVPANESVVSPSRK